MISVTQSIPIYEIDGAEAPMVDAPGLTVNSHWNRNDMVEVSFEGKSVVVSAADLRAALTNATNTARHG